MRLPFTVEQFFDTFRRYNEAVWPAQWVLYVLALAIVVAALRPTAARSRVILASLAFLWFWMAVAYHLMVFREVNPVATVFAALFVAQAALFAWIAVRRSAPEFRVRWDGRGVAGGVLVLYALAVYPVLGHLLGHRYPAAPTFGLPCPTTIFTFGVLLWATPAVPRLLLAIPAAWALLGFQAILLGVREDIGLILGAVVAVALSIGRRSPHAPTPRARGDGLQAAAEHR